MLSLRILVAFVILSTVVANGAETAQPVPANLLKNGCGSGCTYHSGSA